MASFRPDLDSDGAVTLCCIPADDKILIYPKLLNLDIDLFFKIWKLKSAVIYVTSARPSLLVQPWISSTAERMDCHGRSSQGLDIEERKEIISVIGEKQLVK